MQGHAVIVELLVADAECNVRAVMPQLLPFICIVAVCDVALCFGYVLARQLRYGFFVNHNGFFQITLAKKGRYLLSVVPWDPMSLLP